MFIFECRLFLRFFHSRLFSGMMTGAVGGIVSGTGTANPRGRTDGETLPAGVIGTGWEEARGEEEIEVKPKWRFLSDPLDGAIHSY